MIPPPPRSTLFPYTTLFRSATNLMFVLTKEEKRVICFVMLAILVGLGVKEYRRGHPANSSGGRSEEHTSELQSLTNLVCRLLLEKKNKTRQRDAAYDRPARH